MDASEFKIKKVKTQMRKKILKKIGLVFSALLMFSLGFTMPVLASLEWTTTVLYFNVAAADEVTVTLYGESGQATSDTGAATPQDIEFNSSTGTDFWLNGTVTGDGGSAQDESNPIIQITNTGNTVPNTINITITGTSLDACQKLRFHNDTMDASPETSADSLNATENVTIATSYPVGATALDLWLYGNFTGCGAADDTDPTLRIYADFP